MIVNPNQLAIFDCPDKFNDERWEHNPRRAPGNVPSPFRLLVVGPPSCGKSCLILNTILEQDPPFEEIYVIHLDAGVTREYDRLEPTAILNDIPCLEFWNKICAAGHKKRAIVIDDLEWTKCSPDRIRHLAELMRYGSSHKGISVLVSNQSFFDTPTILRKMTNVFCIFKPNALSELAIIANRVGLTKQQIGDLFDEYNGPRDFITVDHSIGSPYPLRLGLAQPIELPTKQSGRKKST